MEPIEKFNKQILEILHKIKDWILYTSSPDVHGFFLSEDDDKAFDEVFEESLLMQALEQVRLITNLKGGYAENKKHFTFTVNEDSFDAVYNKLNNGEYYLDRKGGKYVIVDSDSEEIVHPSQSDATQSGKPQTANKKKINKTSLSDIKIDYSFTKHGFGEKEFIVGGKTIPLGKNQYDVCKFMADKNLKELIHWNEIHQYMTGIQYPEKKDKKTIYNAVYDINEKIQLALNTTDELFTFKNNKVQRNY